MSDSPEPTVFAANDSPPAPAAAPAAAPTAIESTIGEILRVTRKWQTSLTLQGLMLAGAATFVAAKGPALLVALSVNPAVAKEMVGDIATLMGAAGTLMGFVGRLRLGDLR
jgi:hypothetical protein